jgi:outer membrane lipoprotein SlyB
MHSQENNAMETKSRLHPLLTAAAISVTVFSAVGVGALTGLVPPSIGSSKDASVLQIPQEVAKPIEPAITHPLTQPQPAAKPAYKKPVAYSDFGHEAPIAQAPAAATETPKPAVKPGHVGTIQSVREVKDPGQHTGLGPIAGGVAGAVLGNQFGKGNTRNVLTVLGAAGGAYAGREVEKQARATKHWEIEVRRDDGLQETVRSEIAPRFTAGERVRLVDGRLQPV